MVAQASRPAQPPSSTSASSVVFPIRSNAVNGVPSRRGPRRPCRLGSLAPSVSGLEPWCGDLPHGGSSVIALVLAHQGGRDEILLVLVPILLFAGLLAVAYRRAAGEQARREAEEPDEPASSVDPT